MAVSALTIAKGEGFRIWAKSIIGEKPQMTVYEDYVEIDFTPEQRKKFIAYLDRQVGRMFQPTDTPPPDLQIRFGKVLIPWSMRYMAPVMVGAFGLGFIVNALTKKQR